MRNYQQWHSKHRAEYNEYVKTCWRRWLKNAKEARLSGNNERFWYCAKMIEYNRNRYMYAV